MDLMTVLEAIAQLSSRCPHAEHGLCVPCQRELADMLQGLIDLMTQRADLARRIVELRSLGPQRIS